MKIAAIRAENILSFNKLVLENLNPKVNVIVGPNNSGKTNLIRILKLAKGIIEHKTRKIEPIILYNDKEAYFKIEIDVELDGADVEVLKSFIEAYVHSSFKGPSWKDVLQLEEDNEVIEARVEEANEI